MSRINFAPNLFLGNQEIKNWWKFLVDDGYKAIFKKSVASFGFVVNAGEIFDDLKVVPGTQADRLTIKAGSLIDSNMNIINVPTDLVDQFTVPNDNLPYKIVISYAETTEEVGTVSVDLAGNLTGVGTKFTEVLRGAPYHPIKIKFLDASLNLSEYEVLEVISDTQAVLNAPNTLAVENDLTYGVVGTFSPGIIPAASEKYPYRYDSNLLQLTTSPLLAGQEGNTHFILGTATNNGGSVTIVDTRGNYIFEFTQSSQNISLTSNPLLGVREIRWDGEYGDKGGGRVKVDWGFTSQDGEWTINQVTNVVVLSGGTGGIFATIGAITNDIFNGWRIYFSNGNYTNIVDTRQVGGSVQLDIEDSSISSSGSVVIVPPADLVMIRTESVKLTPPIGQLISVDVNGNINAPVGTTVDTDEIDVLNRSYLFPSLLGGGRIEVPYTGSNRFRISAKFIVGSSGKATDFIFINNGQYRNENNWDSNGVSTGNPLVFTTTYQSTVALFLNPENHYVKKAWLDKPNRFTELQSENFGDTVDNTANLLDLGDDGNNFNVNVVANDIKGIIEKPVGTKVFLFPNNPVTLKVEALDAAEILAGFVPIETTTGGTSIALTQDDVVGLIKTATSWKVFLVPLTQQLPQVAPPVGSITMWDGSFAGNFDATGLGIVPNLAGWAICNGNNGTPDLRGRFIVGAINSVPSTDAPNLDTEVDPTEPGNTNFAMGGTGGEQKHTLTESEMPTHNHTLTDPGHNHTNGDFDQLLRVTGTDTQTDNDSTANEPDIVQSGTMQSSTTGITLADAGGDEAHENLPPYYVLAYIKRIA